MQTLLNISTMKSKILFHDQKIEIPYKNGFVASNYNELMYIIYEVIECELHFITPKKLNNRDIIKCINVEISLEQMLNNLPNDIFFQCNRKTIINISCCKEYDWKQSTIVMDDGSTFRLSRRRLTQFKKHREKFRNILLLEPTSSSVIQLTETNAEFARIEGYPKVQGGV